MTVMSRIAVLLLAAAALGHCVGLAVAQPRPANTLNDLFADLRRCWNPPDGSVGLEATLRFSLRRDGSVIGKPAITYRKLGADEALNRAFVASVLGGLESCTPAAITPGLGGAIAGRMLTIRHNHTAEGPQTFVLLAPLNYAALDRPRRHSSNRSLRIAQRNLLGKRYGRLR